MLAVAHLQTGAAAAVGCFDRAQVSHGRATVKP